MAVRGSAGTRLQGNARGGILRDLDRRTRSTTKRRGRPAETPTAGPPGPRGEAGPPGPPGPAAAATVLLTGDGGRARWEYPGAFTRAPVLTAVAVCPGEGDGPPVHAVLEQVEADFAVLRVWVSRPGAVEPVGAGVRVHVTACPVPD